MRQILWFAVSVLSSVSVWAQAPPPVYPLPIPGGDAWPLFVNQFTPGVGPGLDGLNAEPHGITNFDGVTAMGYTLGTAKDNQGKPYQVITDIRVYQGDYVGTQYTSFGTATIPVKAHGTFVEI
jgi:hypothetical protein